MMKKPIFEMKLEMVPIDKIDIGEGNIRKSGLAEEIEELTESLNLIGLQQPPVVFPKKDGRYDLIVGQRRLIAMSKLGLNEVPVLVRNPVDLSKAKIISLSENIQRRRVPAQDMTDAITYLLRELKSPTKVAKALGVNYSVVTKYMSYARIVPDEIKKMVNKGWLTVPDATKITSQVYPDEKKAVALAKKLAKKARETKDRIIDAAREAPKEAPVEEIVEIAKKARVVKEVVVHFPQKYAEGLTKASNHLRLEPEDVIKNITIDWLETEGYV